MLARSLLLGVFVGCAGGEPGGEPGTETDPTDEETNGTGPTEPGTETDTETEETTDTDPPTGTDCAYPAGAVEPMALGQVLSPYRWPVAIHRDGRQAPLDLANVPCADDAQIDWSPHDALVFVSIPAW